MLLSSPVDDLQDSACSALGVLDGSLCASLAEGEAQAVRDSGSLACQLVVVLISASKLAHPEIKVATKWLKVQLTAVRPGSPWADSRPGVPWFRH